MKKVKSVKKTKEGYKTLYLKANRKGQREGELVNSSGWSSKTKVHKSKKQYSRKQKSRENDFGSFVGAQSVFVFIAR